MERLKRAAVVQRLRDRIGTPPTTHDRYLLEEVIFPVLRTRADVKLLLFVGCDHYTASYPAAFADRSFMTMDIDPAKAPYGADQHIIDDFANAATHFTPGSLDVVICNGVIGWGLDDPQDISQAVNQAFECIRPGGIFIVGWNDIEPWRPVPFEDLSGFSRFTPLTLEPFPAPVYPTLGRLRHVFNFYTRAP